MRAITEHFQQPTWGPTGLLAVTQMNDRRAAVFIYNVEGALLCQVYTAYPPFYIYWSPCGTRLTFLSAGVKLSYVDLLGVLDSSKPVTLSERDVDSGRPYFYSWSPDNRGHLLCHKNSRTKMLIDSTDSMAIRMTQESASNVRSSWTAPFWIYNEPKSDIYECVQRVRGDQHGMDLTIGHFIDPSFLDKNWKEIRELLQDNGVYIKSCVETHDYRALMKEILEFGQELIERKTLLSIPNNAHAHVTFVPSPDSRVVATTYTQNQSSIHLIWSDGETRLKIERSRRIEGFFWSPNSKFLLFIEELSPRESLWGVYSIDEKRHWSLSSFYPSTVLLEHYLPFMAQYAQNITFFSPESDRFVYCSGDNVYTHSIQENSSPTPVGQNGQFATWSVI